MSTSKIVKLCKYCLFWEREQFEVGLLSEEDSPGPKPLHRGICSSSKFKDTSENLNSPELDGLAYSDLESYAASFTTGPNFGCIHFEIRD